MGGADPERHDVEWLDDARPPGRVRRFLDGRLSTRRTKGALVLLAAAATTLAVVAWRDDTGAELPDEPASLSEPLARSIDEAAGERGDRREPSPWEVVGVVPDGSDPRRRLVEVVNRSAEPQRVGRLRVTGAFRGSSPGTYRSVCRMAGPPAPAGRPVASGGSVVLRCVDLRPRQGEVRPLDRGSLRVVPPAHVCESEGRRAPY
jgi:hypothetical protein